MRALIAVFLALALAGCASLPGAAPTPLPTVVLTGGAATPAAAKPLAGGGIVASGVVVPAEHAFLAFPAGGKVISVTVAVGDQVQAGQVLLTLAGGEKLAAALAAAHLEVLNAQQALTDLKTSASLNAAQAQLAAAQAQEAVTKAEKALKLLAAPDLAYFRDQVNRAQARLTAAQQNAQITDFQTNVQAAKDALETATNDLKKYKDLEAAYPGYSQQHGNALENAQKAYDRAQQAYQSAVYQSQQAQANNANTLADAQRAYDTARGNLQKAQAGPDPDQLALAQAQAALAQAALADAQTRAATLQAGPDPAQVTLAQARLDTASAQAAAAQAALADLELRAPFSGAVIAVNSHAGEWATPGQPVLELSDVAHLRVETTDLSERDVPQLAAGQAVTVWVKALNAQVPGRVAAIAPLAASLGGDVIYTTTIDLEQPPEGLRAGMSVEVRFAPSP